MRITYDGDIYKLKDKTALLGNYLYIGATKVHGAPIFIQDTKTHETYMDMMMSVYNIFGRSLIIRDWQNEENWIGTVIS